MCVCVCVIGSNGPLAGAIVMWKNSLVFHDIDKMISLFIHIYPPIGTPRRAARASRLGSFRRRFLVSGDARASWLTTVVVPPPCAVTYCLRWWHSDSFVVCRDADCSISWTASFWMPLMLYSFWQVRSRTTGTRTLTRC